MKGSLTFLKASVMPDIFFRSIRISSASKSQIAESILHTSLSGQHFHFLAASTVVAANRNPYLITILNHGTSFCDSKPLSKFLDIFKAPIANVRGVDAFRETIINSTISDRHYLIGTDDLTLTSLNSNLLNLNPNFNLVGSCTLNFLESYDESYELVLKDLKIQRPSIVWVGLGSPKQDYLAEFVSREFPSAVVAVGAAFDFMAGRKTEAPKVMQKFGLEWLFRFGSEPGRLWKRYTIGNLQFISLCMKEMLQILISKVRS